MIVLDHVKSGLFCPADKMSFCLPTLSASCYVPGSPSADVHTWIMIQIQTLVHLCKAVKLQDMGSLLGTMSMQRYQKGKIQATAYTLDIHCKKWETKLQDTSKVYPITWAKHCCRIWTKQICCIGSRQRVWQWRHSNAQQWWHQSYKTSMQHQTLHLVKFHACLAYLLELGYDVAIQPSLNVSSNPDLKLFIGKLG